jgi:ABC-type branched-subunit amino acid transport system ATPase component
MSEMLLDCRGLTVRFGGVLALNALDLTVHRGEILGLIGPNGSGKTTFFNAISGVYRSTAGSLQFNGEAITRLSSQALCRRGLARTFQRSRLCLSLSVFDNVVLGAHRRINSGILHNMFFRRAFAKELQGYVDKCAELLAIFNPQLASRLFDPAIALGMIDRRRVEICRALIGEPKLLLLDEPSAGMTHEETSQLMSELLDVRRRFEGLTIVIIEHEMGVIERVTDRCVVLNYGRKICEGRFLDVAADPVVREAYLGRARGSAA